MLGDEINEISMPFTALIWTAPEFLSENCKKPFTKAADVYSYGIILKEIASRADPYEESCLSPQGEMNFSCFVTFKGSNSRGVVGGSGG